MPDSFHSPVSILAVARHVVDVVNGDNVLAEALENVTPLVAENVKASWSRRHRTIRVELVLDADTCAELLGG